jgi:hypothetical protein
MSIKDWDKNFEGTPIIQFNYETDEEVNRFPSIGKASRITGIGEKTITASCYNKPKKKDMKAYSGLGRDGIKYYFKLDHSKGKK